MSWRDKLKKWADSIREKLKPLANPVPTEPAPTPSPEPSAGVLKYEAKEIWHGAKDVYKMLYMWPTPWGLCWTCSNVFGEGSNLSALYLNGREITRRKGVETIGNGVLVGGVYYLPAEHSSKILRLENGKVLEGVTSPGRWAVAGLAFNGIPLIAFNNEYHGRKMTDRPKIVDARTGKKVIEVPKECFVMDMFEHNRKVGCTVSFGYHGLWFDGEFIDGDFNCGVSYGGMIYLGGGAIFGTGQWDKPNGKLYQFNGSRVEVVADTKCAFISELKVLRGRLYIAASSPDTLFEYDGRSLKKVMAIGTETAANHSRAFDVAVAEYGNHLHFGRCDQNRSTVFELSVSGAATEASQPPVEIGGVGSDAFDWSRVKKYVSIAGDIRDWSVTSKMEKAEINGKFLDSRRTGGNWPCINGLQGNFAIAVEQPDKSIILGTWDWERCGKQEHKELKNLYGEFKDDFGLRTGARVWFFNTAFARDSRRTVKERSDLYETVWK